MNPAWRVELFNALSIPEADRRRLEVRFQQALEEHFGGAEALNKIVLQYLHARESHIAAGAGGDSSPALLLDEAEEAVEARVWEGLAKPAGAVFDFEEATPPSSGH